MDKLLRKVIICVAIVLLLVAGYIALTVIPGRIDEINLSEEQGQTGDIVVMSSSIDNLKSVTVTNLTETYTLEKNEDGWGVKEYPGMNFDKANLESAVYGFANIYAKEEVETPDDLSEYGFDAPRAKVGIVLADGTERNFALGNNVAGGSGDFFMDVTNNKVYVISVYDGDALLKDIKSYRKTNLATIASNDVTRIAITNANGRVVMELEESAYSSEMVMRMSSPKHMDLDETIATPIFDAIQDISVVKYIEDSPKDLSKYGLANPAVIVEIGTTKGDYTIRFGDKAEQSVYAMLDGVDSVFLHTTALYNACENITAYSLMSKFVNIVNIADVKSITVEGKGKKHTLEIAGTDDFYIDGNAALAESFRKTYQTIIGIKGSGLAENNISSPAEYTVEFEYKTGDKTVVQYASYDDLNYYAEVNGERGFVTLKKGLDAMMETVETLAKNPMGKMN